MSFVQRKFRKSWRTNLQPVYGEPEYELNGLGNNSVSTNNFYNTSFQNKISDSQKLDNHELIIKNACQSNNDQNENMVDYDHSEFFCSTDEVSSEIESLIDKRNEFENNISIEYEESQYSNSIENEGEMVCEYNLNDFEDVENIYEGSQISVKNSSFYILGFMERFNLSEVCREELLKLLQYHLPFDNKVVKTINKLNCKLKIDKLNVVKKKFCQKCRLEVIHGPSHENDEISCNCNNPTGDFDHFLYMDVFDQISFLVTKYYDIIRNYQNKERDYIDLIDGEYYKSIKKQDKLHVIIYSDGTPIRNTTKKKQFWPVILGLAELPLSIRDSIKNKIICGKKIFKSYSR